MSKEPITSKHAPAAIGPYSQAIRAGWTVYLSGQIGLDPATGNLVDGVEKQAHQVLKNLRAVAQAAGGELDDIVKVTLLLADMAGVRVFVTGGIGGVHRGGELSLDISADLCELGRTPVCVVCASTSSSDWWTSRPKMS